MSAPLGQSSDSHIQMDPVFRPQDNDNPLVATGIEACARALSLLENLQGLQRSLPRKPALALERAAFCEVFDHPEPALRIRRFLDKR